MATVPAENNCLATGAAHGLALGAMHHVHEGKGVRKTLDTDESTCTSISKYEEEK